jgi:hypothetical protein
VISGDPNSHISLSVGLKTNLRNFRHSIHVPTIGCSCPSGGKTFCSTSFGPQVPGLYS